MSEREFDLIVFGATGFTGRLVAEHLQNTYGSTGGVRWAMAGRDQTKLETVAREIGASAPLLRVNASDAPALGALAQRTRTIITTVGPYQLYGEPLIAACAANGTDYLDLCGEPNWIADMIARYEGTAKQSGARIVCSSGFDSIPFDCGVWNLQHLMRERYDAPAQRVRGRVRKMKGTFSGGTLASMLATIDAAKRDPTVMTRMADPFALCPERLTPQPRGDQPVEESDIGWSAPFVMAPINTKNVHRTNALTNYSYGRDFVYDEMQWTGEGDKGRQRAKSAASQMQTQMVLLALPPTRAVLRQFFLPKPGQGPSKDARETGFYDVLFLGETSDGRTLKAAVTGDKDPGYGSTSKMIAEAALCLNDTPRAQTPGGFWTPAAAMTGALIARLEAKAGLRFFEEA